MKKEQQKQEEIICSIMDEDDTIKNKIGKYTYLIKTSGDDDN